jgi:hypothetical protein
MGGWFSSSAKGDLTVALDGVGGMAAAPVFSVDYALLLMPLSMYAAVWWSRKSMPPLTTLACTFSAAFIAVLAWKFAGGWYYGGSYTPGASLMSVVLNVGSFIVGATLFLCLYFFCGRGSYMAACLPAFAGWATFVLVDLMNYGM